MKEAGQGELVDEDGSCVAVVEDERKSESVGAKVVGVVVLAQTKIKSSREDIINLKFDFSSRKSSFQAHSLQVINLEHSLGKIEQQ